MSFKIVMFYVGCAVAWFILLPLFFVGGLAALLAYAILTEVNESFVGGAKKAVDNSAAREIARRVCLGN